MSYSSKVLLLVDDDDFEVRVIHGDPEVAAQEVVSSGRNDDPKIVHLIEEPFGFPDGSFILAVRDVDGPLEGKTILREEQCDWEMIFFGSADQWID